MQGENSMSLLDGGHTNKVIFVFYVIGVLCLSRVDANQCFLQEIEEMAEQDNAIRMRWIHEEDPAARHEIARGIRLLELSNTQKLRKSLSGSELSIHEDDVIDDFCRLVLRSSDLDFQKNVLEKITTLKDDSWTQWVPQLTDRILLREGKPQRYGTHLHLKSDLCIPYPIENWQIVDSLREEFSDLPLETYIQSVRQSIFCIRKNEKAYRQKLFFNQDHDFYGDPDDYLYVIQQRKLNASISEVGSSIAFEHPTHAAIYALRNEWDWDYELEENAEFEGDANSDFVICYRDLSRSALLNNSPLFFQPCRLFLLPRKDFQPYPNEDPMLNQIFIAPKNIKPIASFVCDSLIDPLSAAEKKIQIFSLSGTFAQIKECSFDPDYICSFWFDITLENEDF
ncbi:MAG: hypothetical protein RL235_402 [Chlamydiota bacterium]|jgi:hypothetical protein